MTNQKVDKKLKTQACCLLPVAFSVKAVRFFIHKSNRITINTFCSQ